MTDDRLVEDVARAIDRLAFDALAAADHLSPRKAAHLVDRRLRALRRSRSAIRAFLAAARADGVRLVTVPNRWEPSWITSWQSAEAFNAAIDAMQEVKL